MHKTEGEFFTFLQQVSVALADIKWYDTYEV